MAATPEKIAAHRLASLRAGKRLAQAAEGEQIVISGISGSFPDSDSVKDLEEKLFSKVDLISGDGRRWKLEHSEIPQRTGKLNEVSKFDAAFFGIHFKQAHTMDPMCRILLEKAYEAVVDSGYNPRQLRGTKTGVFVGACFSESEKTWLYEKNQVNGFGITGCSRAMLANRISYWLGINGPSYTVDSACSSSLYAMEHAYKSIRDGHCDAALVGGCNLCLHPYVSLQLARLGVLSQDGSCKSFDEAANGYARSEAVVLVYLQKAKDARRVYATVIHAKTNCDGYKEQGITYPSGPLQQRLLEEFYEECQVDPNSLAWVEAHGTGTKVGDLEEVKVLENVFCAGRSEPLQIGSVKSNLGHSEPAAALCSVAKVLIAMETGFIPPNINFHTPRADIDAFHNGKITVVTEKTPWNGGLVGINSFGFGGANCHVLLKWNDKNKVNGGRPTDPLLRLVVTSGRTEEAVDRILYEVENMPIDVEFIKLLHEVHSEEIPGHIYRGYTIINAEKTIKSRNYSYYSGEKRPVWFVFSGMGSQWAEMGTHLMKIPVFAGAIHRCCEVLRPKNVDVLKIITDTDPKIFDNIINSFIGIAAIQIGLVDVLKSINIIPDYIIGHSVGELGCAYADGCLTAEQMILAAYYRGLATTETDLIKGAMAAIGLGYHDIKDRIPLEIDVACYNGPDSCTISGPAQAVKKFVAELQAQNIFAREVNVSNIAYHSRYIANAAPKLLKYLKQVIPVSKPRTSRWFSTSISESQWESQLAKESSPEYYTNNLLSPVLFEETSRHIHQNAVTVEIAPHGLLQTILRRSLGKDCINIALTQKDNIDSVQFLLTAVGKMFEAGLNPHLSHLYPHVPLPVSRGTPMISPLIKWEHSEDWYVTSYRMQEKIKFGERTVNISLKDDDLEYLGGHVIDGRNLYPATGYLTLAWETVGLMRGELYTEVSVVFENVRFLRETNIPKDGTVDLIVMVQKGTGNFEVVEGGAAIVTGRVYVPEDVSKEIVDLAPPEVPQSEDLLKLTTRDIYKELRLRGYNYKGLFRSLESSDNTGTIGHVSWRNNWVAFMDNMLQMQLLNKDTRGLYVQTSMQKLVIDIKKHVQVLHSLPGEVKEFPVYVYEELGIIKSGGVEMRGLKASAIQRRKQLAEPVLEKYQFVPYVLGPQELNLSELVRVCAHLSLENISNTIKVKSLELLDSACNPDVPLISTIILQILGDLPLIQADVNILSPADNPQLTDLNPAITVEDKKLVADQSAALVVVSGAFSAGREEILKAALDATKSDACVLSREKLREKINATGIEICLQAICENEKLVLFRKSQEQKIAPAIVKVVSDNFSWLPELQSALKSEEIPNNRRVILYAEKETDNGIIGLFNCIRKEPGGDRARCVFIMDSNAPPFSLDDPFYKQQLAKDLALNVYKNSCWGSYRHLHLENNPNVLADHAYVNVTVCGDLSSLRWQQGPYDLKLDLPRDENNELVHVYYAAVNFRDIMTATGRLSPEVITRVRYEQDCVQGIEYAGRTKDGKRVMGMLLCKGLANLVDSDKFLMFDVPDEWTLEDACTTPVVYGTAVYALCMIGKMCRGEKVLIHAGTGGVGQAAITIALSYGCTVFTTVGTQEKRDFIKQQFPQLHDNNIGNSRDTSFEQLVMKETNGYGVDLVLNSLAEEKLLASLRCLANGGRFLEIGKFDLANNNPLGMEIFLKATSFHGVMLDIVFSGSLEVRQRFRQAFKDHLDKGAIRPLVRTVFPDDQVEQAFRYMAAGKHIGKVLIKIRDEEPQMTLVPEFLRKSAIPRVFCDPRGTYIIIGGLGGLGLELADWLVLRGCRTLVLTSQTGLRTGYQAMRIRIWRGYGAKVSLSTADITSEEGVTELLTQANKLGYVAAIFNLAVVLKDALFENQTEADFSISIAPKAEATRHLDRVSRKLCPKLRHFVIFSSVSCGRGLTGQTNYGMGNSVVERICELRHKEGLPALAVQWGAVGDVGMVAEMQEDHQELVIGGTLQQRITSCLEVLDGFMKQDNPIVSSMVVAEKIAGGGVSGNIFDTVINILGLRDLKTVSLHSTLAELGMDSMIADEIKQTLEREFEVFLTPQDIRGMTLAKLQEIAAATETNAAKSKESVTAKTEALPDFGINHLLRVIGDEMTAGERVVKLPSLHEGGEIVDITNSENLFFLIPGIEGIASVLEPLAVHLKAQALCLQFDYEVPHTTIGDLAASLIPHIKKWLPPGAPFNLVGYSFGGCVAVDIVHKLEMEGRHGHLWLIDSAPDFLRSLVAKSLDANMSDDLLQVNIILRFVDVVWDQDTTQLEVQLKELPNWQSRVDFLVTNSPEGKYSKRYQKQIMNATYYRVSAVLNYEGVPEKCLNSQVTLIRPSEISMASEEDYGLSKYFKNPVKIHFVEGNRVTILENKKTADLINNRAASEVVEFKKSFMESSSGVLASLET